MHRRGECSSVCSLQGHTAQKEHAECRLQGELTTTPAYTVNQYFFSFCICWVCLNICVYIGVSVCMYLHVSICWVCAFFLFSWNIFSFLEFVPHYSLSSSFNNVFQESLLLFYFVITPPPFTCFIPLHFLEILAFILLSFSHLLPYYLPFLPVFSPCVFQDFIVDVTSAPHHLCSCGWACGCHKWHAWFSLIFLVPAISCYCWYLIPLYHMVLEVEHTKQAWYEEALPLSHTFGPPTSRHILLCVWWISN